MIDTNGNGLLSVRELENASRVLGYNPTRDEVKQMISDVDEDGKALVTT